MHVHEFALSISGIFKKWSWLLSTSRDHSTIIIIIIIIMHFMFPTKVACILISAYWYQFIMNSVKILGLFCRKNCQYSLYHSWNLNRKFGRKKGLFFAKITSSRFGPGSFQFCSPSYWRLTNPCNNITVSLLNFIHSSKTLVVKPIKCLPEGWKKGKTELK